MIIKNAAKCRRCGDVIESKHRHDFVSCKCKSIFVDGGKEYLRCGGLKSDITLEDIIDMSITEGE